MIGRSHTANCVASQRPRCRSVTSDTMTSDEMKCGELFGGPPRRQPSLLLDVEVEAVLNATQSTVFTIHFTVSVGRRRAEKICRTRRREEYNQEQSRE